MKSPNVSSTPGQPPAKSSRSSEVGNPDCRSQTLVPSLHSSKAISTFVSIVGLPSTMAVIAYESWCGGSTPVNTLASEKGFNPGAGTGPSTHRRHEDRATTQGSSLVDGRRASRAKRRRPPVAAHRSRFDLQVVSRAVRPLRRLVRHTHLDCIGRTARPVNIGPPIISRPSVFSWLAVRTRCVCERLACSGSPRLYCRRCRRSATSAWPLRLLLIPQRPAIGYLRRYANSVRSTSRQGETARRSVDGTRCFSSSGRRQLRMNPQREEGPPSPVRGQARGRHRDSARKLIAPRPQGTLALSGTCSGFESSWKTLQGSASPSKVHITR
jgi:hypothetical protein